MGKIFTALEKYRQERKSAVRIPEIRTQDWDVLMRYDKKSGKLNLHNHMVIKDSGTIHRLLANHLILPDGRLTRTGKLKCEAVREKRRETLAGVDRRNQKRPSVPDAAAEQLDPQDIERKVDKDMHEVETAVLTVGLSKSDLTILMGYDRNSGHLLSYDNETGEPDNKSLEILHDRGVLRRLLSAKLIYPGGKLTSAGISLCAKLPQRHKNGMVNVNDAALADQTVDSDQIDRPVTPADRLTESDWTAIMEYDRDTGNLLKYDSETGKLDDRSRALLRDPEAIQRMIDNQMILPGGWLTREAKQACQSREYGFQEDDEKEKVAESERHQPENIIITPEEQNIPEQPARPLEESPKIAVLQAENKENRIITDLGPEPENKSVKRPRKRSESQTVDTNLVSLLDPLSFEAEQFKILRTNLLFPVSGPAPRSILVTSTVPGEGKTFVASNLAVAIAQDIDRYVLVVDCDLRRPQLHTRFGFGDVPGLSDYLANGTSLSELMLNTRINKLSVLPAGKPPPNPAELLSSEKMSDLLEEITQRYKDRMIIIDSPPPKLTAESSFLARQVDGIVMVVNYGKTNRDDVKELVAKLGKDKILGSIINNFDIRSLGYYGYLKYHKYGQYYSVKD